VAPNSPKAHPAINNNIKQRQYFIEFYPQALPTWHGFCYIPDMSDNPLMTQTLKPVITIETKGELQC